MPVIRDIEYVAWCAKLFADAMIGKLAANAHKPWATEPTQALELLALCKKEIEELEAELTKPQMDRVNVLAECADVANFALLIAEACRANRYSTLCALWSEHVTPKNPASTYLKHHRLSL